MAKPKSSTAYIILEADGVKLEAWTETDGDIHLTVDTNEAVILSPASAKIIGLALIQLSEPEI